MVLNKQARVLGTAVAPGATEQSERSTVLTGVREGVRQKRRRKLSAYLYVLPALVLVVGMFWYSAVVTVQLSFTNSSGLGPANYVGLSNYRAMLSDSQLSTNVYNTLIWAVAMVVLPVSIGLGAAILVRSRRGGAVFQTVFYLPYAIGFVTTGVIWSFLFSTNGFSTLFQTLGLHSLASVQWLNDVPLNTYLDDHRLHLADHGRRHAAFPGRPRHDRPLRCRGGEDGRRIGVADVQENDVPFAHPDDTGDHCHQHRERAASVQFDLGHDRGRAYGSSSTFAVWMYTESFELFKMGYGAAIAAILTIFVFAVSIGYLRRSLREVTA